MLRFFALIKKSIGVLYTQGSAALLIRFAHYILRKFDSDGYPFPFLDGRTERLRKQCYHLHHSLGRSDFSYSIVLAVADPNCETFKTCLKSYQEQTAPNYELLIGVFGAQPLHLPPEGAKDHRTKIFHFPNQSATEVVNQLAAQSSCRFIILLNKMPLLRPDLLWRYEQTIQAIDTNPDQLVLTCKEMAVSKSLIPRAGSVRRRRLNASHPYVFSDEVGLATLISKSLWLKCQALNTKLDEVARYDLMLRLDLAGAKFVHLPFFMSAQYEGQVKKDAPLKQNLSALRAQCLSSYLSAKGFNWEVQVGETPNSCRVLPPLPKNLNVQAIILYKDKKELTEKAIASLKQQIGVSIQITLVDNNSENKDLAAEFRQLGCEVLVNNEGFNFSRLNNFAEANAVDRTAPYLLIMNNDVELKPDAVAEMLRWVDQPGIGVVGCRLFYPTGGIQHGGINLKLWGERNLTMMHWHHRTDPEVTHALGEVDAVTAACFLLRRDTFQKIRGFDELFHPIAYSDTDFCYRLKRDLGLSSFYTPFANGIHHESVTRGYNHIEGFESSRWLQNVLDNSDAIKLGEY